MARFKTEFDAEEIVPDDPQPDEPEDSPDAATAEHAADAQAGPEDAAGHGGRPGAAQARGGRGVGGRRDGHRQGLAATSWSSRSPSLPRPSTPTIPSCCRTWSSPPPTRRCAPPRSCSSPGSAASPAAWTWARWACRASSALYPPPVQRLITELGKLPGIGQRTAQRLAFHILRSDAEDATALADAIREVKERIGLCEVCFNLADEPRCRICQDERRDASLICVVEEPGDVIPIERTHEYRGRYHVLGGALSPIDGVDPEDLKIAELYARVANGSVSEVVLATNPTTTGEATALHIAAALRERAPDVAVTRLASGLPVGADLEYADEVTLGKALVGRRAL